MKRNQPRGKAEAILQKNFIIAMQKRGWFVKHIHGNQHLKGMPDLFCHHPQLGFRLVEVKVLKRGRATFTINQKKMFPILASFGMGIWIASSTTDRMYQRINERDNWKHYMPAKYHKPTAEIQWPKLTTGYEALIQENITTKLRQAGWFVIHMHANMFMSGFPDLFCYHPKYGLRLVEIKNPNHFSFTPAQKSIFPRMAQYGIGPWVLFSTGDIPLLYEKPNWRTYFK